ncbi:MAG: HEAT repeat domain-containing protein [Candidatus Omnitrophica bacterium]|nr:HEAT repeat domain-containing protein [Candidatus Omnitrophota bacterium]
MLTNILLTTICLFLLLIFWTYRQDEKRKMRARQPTGQVDSVWDGAERRRHARLKTNLAIAYRVDGEGPAPIQKSRTKNISKGGLCLVMSEKLTRDTRIKLDIEIPGGGQPYQALGLVRRCRERESQDGKRLFEIGIRFLDLAEDDWKKILGHVLKSAPDTSQKLAVFLAALILSGFFLEPVSAEYLQGGVGGQQGVSRTRRERLARRAQRESQEKSLEEGLQRELEEYSRQREERERRIKEAGWFEQAEAHFARQDFDQAYKLYTLLQTPTVDRVLKERALERIQELKENSAFQTIIQEERKQKAIEDLSSEDRVIRLNALKQLGELGDTQSAEVLVATLTDPDPFVRRVAAWALGRIGDPSGVPPLISALHDEHEWIRQEAHGALVQITGRDLGAEPQAWVEWWRSFDASRPAGDTQGS